MAPSSAWHSHDAWHLLNALRPSIPSLRPPAPPPADQPVALLLGATGYYAESGPHWTVGDYAQRNTYMLLGRKVRSRAWPAPRTQRVSL